MRVMCASPESLYCMPETSITLQVKWNLNKNFLKNANFGDTRDTKKKIYL